MEQTLKTIVKALDDKKAVDLCVLKIDKITSLADHFVICSGTSTTHVKTLADECEVATDKIDYPIRNREGLDSGSWVLLDYGDIIVHIYNKDTRNYYSLEKLWKDGTEIDINDLLEAAKGGNVTGGITLSGQPYMFAQALKEKSGIDLYYVDTGNTSERNAALLGGQVDYIITNVMASQGYVDSGDFRFLAIDGEERYELAPDVPTFKEQGVDFCFVAQPMIWLAPKGTDPAVCEAFNKILSDLYADPDVKEEFNKKINTILYDTPSVEESKTFAQEFKDAVLPYAKKQ